MSSDQAALMYLRRPSSVSDDAILLREIMATHAPATTKVDVKSILRAVKSIVYSTSSFISTEENIVKEEAYRNGGYGRMTTDVLDAIQKVSCEMCCNGPVGATTMGILKLLSNFEWEAKLAITLAAFAAKYGEFLLITGQKPLKPELSWQGPTNPLAQSVDLLRQWAPLDLLESSLKHLFANLVRGVVEVTSQMVRIHELKQYFVLSDQTSSTLTTVSRSVHDLPLHIYRFISGIAFCTSILSSRIQPVLITEFQNLAVDIERRRKSFEYQLTLSYQQNVHQIITTIFTTTTLSTITTNMIDILIYSMDDQPPLREYCSSKEWVNIEVLRGKKVLLLISNLSISDEELEILKEKFEMVHEREHGFYAIVWLPITTVDLTKDTSFNNKRVKMIGYTVRHPLLPDAWGSKEEAVLMLVDEQGKIVCTNALHMFRIWGYRALPFTGVKERELWREEKWGIRLLLDTVDSSTLNERRNEDMICMYGGVNKEWLLAFKTEAKKIFSERDMIYVGKSNSTNEQLLDLLTSHNVIKAWKQFKTVYHFWARLASIVQVGHQLVHTGENDVILSKAKILLALDCHKEGWALFGTVGGAETIMAAGESALAALKKCTERQTTETKGKSGLVVTLKEYIESNNMGIMWPRATHHCCCLLTAEGFDLKHSKPPLCAQCNQPMEQYSMFRCCRHP